MRTCGRVGAGGRGFKAVLGCKSVRCYVRRGRRQRCAVHWHAVSVHSHIGCAAAARAAPAPRTFSASRCSRRCRRESSSPGCASGVGGSPVHASRPWPWPCQPPTPVLPREWAPAALARMGWLRSRRRNRPCTRGGWPAATILWGVSLSLRSCPTASCHHKAACWQVQHWQWLTGAHTGAWGWGRPGVGHAAGPCQLCGQGGMASRMPCGK